MIRPFAALALCFPLLAAAGQSKPIILRDHKLHKTAFRLQFENGTLLATAEPSRRGTPSVLRYQATGGDNCELLFSGGQLYGFQTRHPWLHAKPHQIHALPDGHGGYHAFELPLACPVKAPR